MSGGLHLLVIILLAIGLPRFLKPIDPPPAYVIPVEVTEIGAITNTRVREIPEPPKPPQPVIKEQPKPTPPPPQQQAPQLMKAVTPPPQIADKPEVDPAALPDKIKQIKEKLQQQQPPEQLTSVLKNISKLKTETPPDDAKPKTKEEAAPQANSQAPALADRLSISEEDALRRQISQCWNMPVGARDADKLIVEVLIEVNEDRTVRSVEIADQSRYGSDSFFRAAADAAIRALRNPRCSPLALPPDKYQTWQTIRFTFDPRDML